jgi:septum formation protein
MLYTPQSKIILASESPRRRELLSSVLGSIEISSPDFHEQVAKGETPEQYVKRNSLGKAKSVAKIQGEGNWLVIAADTIVVKDGDILEKPKTEADAFKMLKRLSGGAHEVLTGYCLMAPIGPQVIQHIVTAVYFFDLSDTLIERYIATGDPMDKAGAYGIQGLAASFVEKIEGSYTNVVGLPLSHVVRDLELLENKIYRP